MKFSERSAHPVDDNDWTRFVQRHRSPQLLDLTGSNPTSVGLPGLPDEFARWLAAAELRSYRPDAQGQRRAREAVVREVFAADLDPDDLFLAASTSEAYGFCFKALCDPGDELLVPRPSYPLLEHLAGLDGVQVREYYLLREGGWCLDPATVTASPRLRGAVVIHPNNPTGSFMETSEWGTLAALDVPLLADEVFFPYNYGKAVPSFATTDFPAVVMGGLSKWAGLPQLKLSWGLLRGPRPFVDELRRRLEYVADTYLSVSAGVQGALPELLQWGRSQQARIRARCEANLRLVTETTRGTAVSLLPCAGGWTAVLRLPNTETEERWAELILREGAVLVQPGWFYDFLAEPFLVVSLLTEPSAFLEGVKRICRLVEEHTAG